MRVLTTLLLLFLLCIGTGPAFSQKQSPSVASVSTGGVVRLPPLPPLSVFNKQLGSDIPKFELPPLLAIDAQPTSVTANKESPSAPSSSPFLSRNELELRRKRCHLEYDGRTSLASSSKGATLTLLFKNISGAPCMVAASSEAPWAEAILNSKANEVTLLVEPNPDSTLRISDISVLTGNSKFSFVLTQAARVHGCLHASARLDAMPVPDGFQR
jgi:hypothetical protein